MLSIEKNVFPFPVAKGVENPVAYPLNGVMERLGVLVRKYRKDNSLSQSALASRLGVNWQSILNLEKGKTQKLQSEAMQKLAEVMGIPITKLVEAIDEHDPRPIAPAKTKTAPPIPDPAIEGMRFVRGVAGLPLEDRVRLFGQLDHAACREIQAAIVARLALPDGARIPASAGPAVRIVTAAEIDARAAVAQKSKPARRRQKP